MHTVTVTLVTVTFIVGMEIGTVVGRVAVMIDTVTLLTETVAVLTDAVVVLSETVASITENTNTMRGSYDKNVTMMIRTSVLIIAQ